MPVEITVGPPLLSINRGASFMVTDQGGEIQADTEQGVFADDTRFVSYYAISANGVPWQRLNSAATAYFAARVYPTGRTDRKGTAMEPLPVTGLAANFSPILRIAPPPFGVRLARTTYNPKNERFIMPGRNECRT